MIVVSGNPGRFSQVQARNLGAALSGIIANALGFKEMNRIEEYRTAAFWLFAGFVPPALIGNLVAWRFASRIGPGAEP